MLHRRRSRTRSSGTRPRLRQHRRPLAVELLEDRAMLTVTAALNGASDAVITGTANADNVTMRILNQGLATERLQIVDPGGATAGLGFTQDNATTVSILTSAINTSIFINTGDDDDVVNILSTPAGITTNVDTDFGLDNTVVGATLATFNTQAGTLSNILGSIAVTDAGIGSLLVDASNDAAATYTLSSTSVARAGIGPIGYDANVDVVQLATGNGADTIGVTSTSAAATTSIFANGGGDTFNIGASLLDGTNEFFGNAGDDQFNVNITTAAAISAPLTLHGNANDFAGNVGSRDVVQINENAGLGTPSITITYTDGAADGSEVTVEGLGGNLLRVDTAETLRYVGFGGNDLVTVVGTSTANDLITAAPISANRALVFNNAPGNASGPFDGPPQTFANRIPGVSGGSARPDLDLGGLDNLNGLTISDPGPGMGDRLYVYGESTNGLSDGNAFDPFGFGAGRILPAVPQPASFDVIAASETRTRVDAFLAVNYNSTDFRQANPQVNPSVVINSGFEGNPTATAGVDLADDVTVTLSTNYKFLVNGGDPDPATTGVVPPDGDRLNLINALPLSVVNVWALKDPAGGPPAVTIDFSFAVTGLLPIAFTSIENFGPISATTVNLIGDNNNPALDQSDDFVVRGTGPNAFDLLINNATTPLRFANVQFLNVFGDDQNPPPGTPSNGPNDIDTLDIRPYADNTPRGWGIDVFFNEGNPAQTDGAQDLLIYHTAFGLGGGGTVSENITIQPSGPDNGELRVTNQAFGTPVVVISYLANTDIVIVDDDGSSTDNDALFLRGTDPNTPQTSGNETFVVDFDAAGMPASPMVVVTDTANSMILYRVRSISGIHTVNFDLGDGNDTLTFRTPAAATGFPSGINQVNVLGGRGDDSVRVDINNRRVWQDGRLFFDGGAGADALTLVGTPTAAVNLVDYTPGPAPGQGRIVHFEAAVPNQIVDFVNLEPVIEQTVATNLTVHGNGAANSITYTGDPNLANHGRVTVDALESITFNMKEQLIIDAQAGDDVVVLDNSGVPTGLQRIFVFGAEGNDQIRLENLPAAGGTFQGVMAEGGSGNDVLDGSRITVNIPLNLHGNAGDDVITGGAGNDTLVGGAGDDLLIDSPGDDVYDGGEGFDSIIVRGTFGNDTLEVFQLAPSANATDNYALQVRRNGALTTESISKTNLAAAPADAANRPTVEEVRVEALAGNDLIRVTQADQYFDGISTNGVPEQLLRISVDGGSPNASDRLIVRDDGLGDLVLVRQAPDSRSGRVTINPVVNVFLGEVVYQNIERLDIAPIDPITGGTGPADPSLQGRVVVFQPDEFELNDTRLIATDFGDVATTHRDPNIDPGGNPDAFGEGDGVAGDEDWYEFRPTRTSTFAFNVRFAQIATVASGRPGLPGNGDLDIAVYDQNGVLVAVGSAVASGEQVAFGAQAGMSYFLRVKGAALGDPFSVAINTYDLELTDLDDAGPQITDIFVTGFPNYDLFDPKPSTDGPTPLVTSLTVRVQDLPPRAPGFLYPALNEAIAENPGHYLLVGDFSGVIPIASIDVINDPVVIGQPATATIIITFVKPLPDDRFTLTIRDGIVDPPGNKLDGESNNIEPQETPFVPPGPSGDGIAGGNFVARFTVDTRPEIGVWAAGIIHIDTNGNFHFDPENVDFTNRDLIYTLGFSSDYIFAGNFVLGAGAVADGFDKLAVYGRVGGQWRFLIDVTNDGVPDAEFIGPDINGIPVAGNFDGNAANGDEVAIFTGSAWYFDTNHDFIVDLGIATSYAGFPVVGDFDGDGDDDVATYVASQAGGNLFVIDLNDGGAGVININGSADYTFRMGTPGLGTYGFPGVRERPVAADMNGDGADDLGLWVPDGTAIVPGDQGEWFFLLSDFTTAEGGGVVVTQTVISRIVAGGVVDFVPFSTTPFGQDLYARFGNSFALPIVGNFDPPVTSQKTTAPKPAQSSTSTSPTATVSTGVATAQKSVSPVQNSSNVSNSAKSISPSVAAVSALPTPPAPVPKPASTVASAASAVSSKTKATKVTKIPVPPVAPAPATTKVAAQTKSATTSVKVAKTIAVPAIQPAAATKAASTKATSAVAAAATTTVAAMSPAKTTKATAKIETPAVQPAPVKAKATKATKASKPVAEPIVQPVVASTTATSKAAKATSVSVEPAKPAPPAKAVAVQPAVSNAKSTAAKSAKKVATPAVAVSQSAVTLGSSLIVSSSEPIVSTTPVAAPPQKAVSVKAAAVSPSQPQLKASPITRVAPPATVQKNAKVVDVRPAVATASIVATPAVSTLNTDVVSLAGVLPVATSTGTRALAAGTATMAIDQLEYRPAVADAAVTDLLLTLADVTTDTDVIAADRTHGLSSTGDGDGSSESSGVLAFDLAWDSLLFGDN